MADELFIQQPRVLALAILFPLYFVVWTAMAIGWWLFFRGRDAESKWRWRPAAALVFFVVIGGLLLAIVLLIGGWLPLLLFAVPTVAMSYVGIFRTTLCHSCGKGSAVSFSAEWGCCRRCGVALRPPAPIVSHHDVAAQQ